MKSKKILFAASFFLINLVSFSQQIGDGLAPIINDFTIPLQSGVYNGFNANGTTPDADPWQHLLVIRHPNINNNHQLQLVSSLLSNDRLFFRKIASGNLSSQNPSWHEIATRGANTFSGNQIVNGSIGIETSYNSGRINTWANDYTTILSTTRSDNTQPGKLLFDGWGNYAFNKKLVIGGESIDIASLSETLYVNGNALFNTGNDSTVFTKFSNDRLRVGYLNSTTSFPTNLQDAQIVMQGGGSENLFIASRGNSASSITFHTSAGSNIVERMKINSAGNVGIGTTNPTSKLDVNGVIQVYNKDNNGATWDNLRIWADGGNSYIESNGDENGLIFRSNTGNKILLMNNVGIGTANPDQKLTVKGKIHAEEIIVDLLVPADYVFQKYFTGKSELKSDYVMSTLAEIENFAKKNNHLPNVPSAKEIQQKGVSLGEMSNILLQKVEELTLYAIEQNKKLEDQNKTIETQSKLLETLTTRINDLEKK